MKARLGLFAALALVAAPLGATPWSLPRSDVLEARAPDGHGYRVLVAWPEGDAPKAGWPVLWMLDGEDNFAIAAMTARRLARAGKRTGIEPGVIVAIDSGPLARRVEDYTPEVEGYAIPAGKPAHGLPIGGGDAFLDLIQTRIRPMLAERIPLDTTRQTLAGHSFGGLLTLYAARQKRGFSGYAAVSPSLWYGDSRFELNPPGSGEVPAPKLLVAASPERGDAGIRGSARAEALVQTWQDSGSKARFLALPGQDHGSTMLAAMSAIIETAFLKKDTTLCC